jgi:hypothetical protein
MGAIHLVYLTSIIAKWLKEVKMCEIEMLIFLYECLGYVRRKYLLVDQTPTILKWIMEVKMP